MTRTEEQRRIEVEAFRREIHEMRMEWERNQRPKAEVVQFPDRLSDQELYRRQAAIDQAWRRTLDARKELEERFNRGFHKGFGED
jgi:hypothetical protein